MSNVKEIQQLHDRGFVILRASRKTNAPIGWRSKPVTINVNGMGKKRLKEKWGYVEQMADPKLSIYRATFNATILAKSHCGFYLGHGNLCCIDLDTKKVDDDRADKMVERIVQQLGNQVVIERTKSNGYHIYFLFAERLDNRPNYTGLDAKTANWIELYYSKRFIACYLSNSKKYTKTHGELSKIKALSKKEHRQLMDILSPYADKSKPRKKSKISAALPVDESTFKKVNNYVEQIEQKQIDITGDNPQWFKIGKAIANAFGSRGYDLFNRLSAFGPTYNADTIEADYERFVSGEATPKTKSITIATLFKIFEDNGLQDPDVASALQLSSADDTESVKEFDELPLSKKQRMPEHCHIVVAAFVQHIEICCVDQSYFYVYDTTHWQRRNNKEVNDLLQDFISRSEIRDGKFRLLLRTVPYIKMMLEELRITAQRDALEPNTGNLNSSIYVNMENGVLAVDMKTGKRKLLDHESHYNFTTLLPFCYEPAQTSPHFDKWLARQVPDKDLQTAYFAFVASCLTRHKADIIMLLAGETSTGKSSLIDITRRLIGIDNCAAISAGNLFSGKPEAQTEAMSMENKLLAYDFDSQPFKHLEMLLKVAAQEPIAGWQMHVARRPVLNYGRVLIAMNPYNYSVFNPAVARRLITVNMDVKIEKDNSVMPKVFNEVAGIFNYVLNIGIKHLLENGGQIRVTDAMRSATINFHTKERDSIRWFNSVYYKLKDTRDASNKKPLKTKLHECNKGAVIELKTISEMYNEYRQWLVDEEGYSESRLQLRKHFADDLKNYGVAESVLKIDSKSIRGMYVGKR